jgi:hypothetical protein
MFTAQEFNENLKKKRMGDFSYNLEKTKDYIKKTFFFDFKDPTK